MNQKTLTNELKKLRTKLYQLAGNHRHMLKRNLFTTFQVAGASSSELPEFVPLDELELVTLRFHVGWLSRAVVNGLTPAAAQLAQPFSATLSVRRFVREHTTGMILSDPQRHPTTLVANFELNPALTSHAGEAALEASPYQRVGYTLLTTALRDFAGEGYVGCLTSAPPLPQFLLTFDGVPTAEPTPGLNRAARQRYPHLADDPARSLTLAESVVPIIDDFPTYPSQLFADPARQQPGQEPGSVIADLRPFRGRTSAAAWQILLEQRLITGDLESRRAMHADPRAWHAYATDNGLADLLAFQNGRNLLTRQLVEKYRVAVGDFDGVLDDAEIRARFVAANQATTVHTDWAGVQVLPAAPNQIEQLQFYVAGAEMDLNPADGTAVTRERGHELELARSA